jgi:hypothetical protein
MSIFVSIAATTASLAPAIDEFQFGICRQHAGDEAPPPDFADPRLRVIDIPWHDSRGAAEPVLSTYAAAFDPRAGVPESGNRSRGVEPPATVAAIA